MTKQTITYLSIIVIVIGTIFLANGLILAWTAPGAAPPAGNVPAPLNVGSTAQTKSGSLRSDTDIRAPIFYDQNNTGYYVNPAGISKFSTINLGGVSKSSWPSFSESDTLQSVTSRGNTTNQELIKSGDWGMWFGGTNHPARTRIGELWGQAGVYGGGGYGLYLGSDAGYVQVGGNLNVDGSINLGGVSKSSWPTVTGNGCYDVNTSFWAPGSDQWNSCATGYAITGLRSGYSLWAWGGYAVLQFRCCPIE